jgi:hypothetical protein
MERWAPLGGILFVGLMIVGTLFVADVPDANTPASEITAYLADSDNHMRNIIGAYMWVLGALAFLWFLTRLRTVLRRAEGGTGTVSSLAFGAGVVFAALWIASSAAFAAVAYAVELRDAPVSDPDLMRVLPQMAWLLPAPGRWLRRPSAPCGHFHCEPFHGRPPAMARLARDRSRDRSAVRCDLRQHRPLLVWVLAAAIVLLMRREETTTAPATAAPATAPA